MFNKYGKIIGIDINNNGFAFIQFQNVEEAQNAVTGESQNADFLNGRKIGKSYLKKKLKKYSFFFFNKFHF